ncbi:MAG: hypothetical protein D6B26_05480 [Spirochaetaceae bacterium]|nr:MAG: hypothetical protein D6B26_05480 [Spirochaetaceae bacterium]
MNDFGSILTAWEQKHSYSEDIIAKCFDDTDNGDAQAAVHKIAARRLPVEDELDLHAMKLEEALSAVDRFLRQSAANGKRKVLIVHGKGNHDGSSGLLRTEVRKFLEKHELAGETGIPKRGEGGDGATWVAVRQRSR